MNAIGKYYTSLLLARYPSLKLIENPLKSPFYKHILKGDQQINKNKKYSPSLEVSTMFL